MNSLFDKLGIYDFLGYIIPGFLGILATKVLYEDILRLPFPLKIDNGFINSIIFIVISYFVGIIMHEISQLTQEKILKRIWNGFPSERFLLKDDKICSITEKEDYYAIAQEAFHIERGSYNKEKSQLVFDRFRTALQIAGKDERSQLFNTHYGMYRNFSTGTLLCFLTYFSYSIIYVFNLIAYKTRISNDYSFILTGVIFLLFTLLLFRRTKRFGETYVKYVFRGFAEHYRNTQINNQNK
jgi:hypothetical protein